MSCVFAGRRVMRGKFRGVLFTKNSQGKNSRLGRSARPVVLKPLERRRVRKEMEIFDLFGAPGAGVFQNSNGAKIILRIGRIIEIFGIIKVDAESGAAEFYPADIGKDGELKPVLLTPELFEKDVTVRRGNVVAANIEAFKRPDGVWDVKRY